jgi:hypothetical protein
MQPSLLILIFAYALAILSGVLLVASHLYGNGPAWLTDICTGNALLCQYPVLTLALLLPLLVIYRRVEQSEPPDQRAWARRLRRLMD